MQYKTPKIIYSDKGLANFFETHIEINRKLKYNKPLRDYIIKHELGHNNQFDFHHDFIDGVGLIGKPKILFNMIKFCLLNPSTWRDFLPIQVKDKSIVYDLNLCLLYGMISVLIGFSLYIF